MFQMAVCDDNIAELANMVQFLNLYSVSKNFSCDYTVFLNGFELVSALEKGKLFNIYSLVTIMPGLMVIDVAKEIRTFVVSSVLRQGHRMYGSLSTVCDTLLNLDAL